MTKIAGSGSVPDPDPFVRGMDPRIQIRIRIHTKMSWIRNTACLTTILQSTTVFLLYLDPTGDRPALLGLPGLADAVRHDVEDPMVGLHACLHCLLCS
jgi:hypothetical protein